MLAAPPAALADSAHSGAAPVPAKYFGAPWTCKRGQRQRTHILAAALARHIWQGHRLQHRCPNLGWCAGGCLGSHPRRLHAPAVVLGAAQLQAVRACHICSGLLLTLSSTSSRFLPYMFVSPCLCSARLSIKLPCDWFLSVHVHRRLPASCSAASPVRQGGAERA